MFTYISGSGFTDLLFGSAVSFDSVGIGSLVVVDTVELVLNLKQIYWEGKKYLVKT